MFLGSMNESSVRILREDHWREHRLKGNLSEVEMAELERYTFDTAPSRLTEEVREYYLRVKSVTLWKAERMLRRTSFLLGRGVYSLDDVEDLCLALCPYYVGFVLHYEGQGYTTDHFTGVFRKE